jgi:hypothetical protein
MTEDFKPLISLTQMLTDSKLFGETFGALSFWTWKVVAKLIDGIALTEQREIDLFQTCTGRTYDKEARRLYRRIIILAGRRAGKDRFESAVGYGGHCVVIGANSNPLVKAQSSSCLAEIEGKQAS